MPAWNEAKRASKQSRAIAQAERTGPGATRSSLPLAEERFKEQVCVYCCGTAGRKVGMLAISGAVIYCKNHREQYQNDKEWEAVHKRGL